MLTPWGEAVSHDSFVTSDSITLSYIQLKSTDGVIPWMIINWLNELVHDLVCLSGWINVYPAGLSLLSSEFLFSRVNLRTLALFELKRSLSAQIKA